jgi:hypothetical protein
MKFNELTKERAMQLPQMMRLNIKALKMNYEMHLYNKYNYQFGEVASAFIKKYQNES